MKSYILTKNSAEELASAVVHQEGELYLEKQLGTDFYVATVDDDVAVPMNSNIVEFESSPEPNLLNKISGDQKFVELHFRFKLDEELDATFINEKIAPAIHLSIEKVLKENRKKSKGEEQD